MITTGAEETIAPAASVALATSVMVAPAAAPAFADTAKVDETVGRVPETLDGAAIEPAFARPVAHQPVQAQAKADQGDQADDIISGKPDAGIKAAQSREEGDRRSDQEQERPGDEHPSAFAARTAERLDVIDIGGLETEHGECADADHGQQVIPVESVGGHHVGEIDGSPDRCHQPELEDTDEAGNHDRRISGCVRLHRDELGGRGQLPGFPGTCRQGCCPAGPGGPLREVQFAHARLIRSWEGRDCGAPVLVRVSVTGKFQGNLSSTAACRLAGRARRHRRRAPGRP